MNYLMKSFVRLIVAGVLCITGIVPVSAQSVAAAPAAGALQNAQRITVAFDNTSLDEAIRTIARRSGNAVIFAPSLLPVRKVTYKGIDVTPVVALTAVLNGTGIHVARAVDGAFELVQGSSKGAVQGVITGKITDSKTGKGVAGATVSLGNDTRNVVSDENGLYRLSGVSAGTHTVTVRLVGYAKQTRSVNVTESSIVTADFRLEPTASVLDQVVVTGTVIASELKSVPNAITVITAKQIEERGITRIDQLFRGDIPGLFSLNRGTNALLDEVSMFSRGATAIVPEGGTSPSVGTANGTNPIKTYIDGVELSDPQYLSQIDPASIERIEILTGPQASTIYGSNAINGVMQIFTKRGKSSRPQIISNLSGGIAQNNFSSSLAPSYTTDIALSGIEGKISYNLGGSWNYTGSWTPAKQTQRFGINGGGRIEWARISTDMSVRSGLTQNRQNGDAQQVRTDMRATGVWAPGAATQGLPTPTFQSLLGQTIGMTIGLRPLSWWSHDVGFGYDISTNQRITMAPGFSSLSDTSMTINPVTTSRTSQRYTTTMQLHLSSLTLLNLTMGGDHWRTKGSEWRSVPFLGLTGALRSPTVSRTRPGRNGGIFTQGQFALYDALFFTYGIRADWNPNFGDRVKVKPGRYGVSFARDIGAVSAKLRGSYGTSIRPPGDRQKSATPVLPSNSGNVSLLALFGQYDSQLANPDLAPEYQQGGEGGVELYFGSRASLVVTRYNQTVDNLISLVGSQDAISGPGLDSVRSILPDNATGLCSSSFRDDEGHCYRYQRQYINVGSIRNQGWEITGSFNMGPLSTHGTYSWTKSRVLGITPRYRSILGGSAAGSSFEPGRPFDFLPEHTWALGVTYAHSQSSLSLSVNGLGMRYLSTNLLSEVTSSNNRLSSGRSTMRLLSSAGYRSPAAGYATADLNAKHRLSSRLDVTLQINNLTNYYQNDFSSSFSSMGRQTKTGVRIKL